MTLVRVDPESVRGYGREAQACFDTMQQSLVQLVNEVVGVRYFGPNAVAFKTECGRMAAEFATKLHADMGQMADAVKTSTSNIANSLGGEPIVIQLDPKPITPPQPEVVNYVDVDTEALQAMTSVVTQRFTSLRDNLDANLSKLQATDWQGNAKINAVEAVGGFTTSAKSKCTNSEQQLVQYINDQVSSVTTADR